MQCGDGFGAKAGFPRYNADCLLPLLFFWG